MTKRLSILPGKKQTGTAPSSASTGMPKETSVSSPMTDNSTQSSCRLLQRLSETPIAVFKQAYCNNELQGIIVSGHPEPEQLQDAWNEIFFEYASTIKSDNTDYTFQLAKEIGLLEHHITYVDYAVYLLRHIHSPEVVDELIALGYFHLHYSEDKAQWNQQLDRVISLCKTKIFDMEQLMEEYKRLQKTTDGKKQTEEDFNQNVLQLARFQHYRIDQLTTMMDEYVSIFNNMLSESKAREKQNNGR